MTIIEMLNREQLEELKEKRGNKDTQRKLILGAFMLAGLCIFLLLSWDYHGYADYPHLSVEYLSYAQQTFAGMILGFILIATGTFCVWEDMGPDEKIEKRLKELEIEELKDRIAALEQKEKEENEPART